MHSATALRAGERMTTRTANVHDARNTMRLLVLLLMLSVLSLAPRPAAAQQEPAGPPNRLLQRASLNALSVAFRSSFVPVRIDGVSGPATAHVGEEIIFELIANVESATLPIRTTWHLGEGTRAHGLSVRHSFDTPGTYDVVVRLSNGRSVATDTLTVTVVDGPREAGMRDAPDADRSAQQRSAADRRRTRS